MSTSATKELEKASLGEGSNGVVGKTNNEKNKIDMVLWNCSDQTSNSLISVLRCHPWISNADTI